MVWILSLLIIVAVVFFFCCFTYRKCFHSPKDRSFDAYALPQGEQYEAVGEHMLSITRIMDKTPCQWVSTQSRDGLTLMGRYYRFVPDAPIMLLFHGYRSSSLRDSAGAHALARKLGFNVLAVDQRAHGKSQGHVISFGVRERFDCLCWIDYIREHCGANTPIILCGLSMGAATVLMASDLPLPENVAGIIADCPYSSPKAIIRKVCADEGYPAGISYPFIWLGGAVLGGFRLTDSAAEISVKNAIIPILLIHGEDDRFVPCQMSHQIHRENPEWIRLHTFPNAGHGLCYLSDPIRYERLCIDFLKSLPAVSEYVSSQEYVLRMDNTLEVVAALIRDSQGRILICQRPENKRRGLLWEFVGGKVEPGESKVSALIRECREELDIQVSVGGIYTQVLHDYPDTSVHLTLFCCAIESGSPKILEHKDIRWIFPSQIPEFDFCPADQEILELIMAESDTL